MITPFAKWCKTKPFAPCGLTQITKQLPYFESIWATLLGSSLIMIVLGNIFEKCAFFKNITQLYI